MDNNAEWKKDKPVGIHFELEQVSKEDHDLVRAYQFLGLQVVAPFTLGNFEGYKLPRTH
jgi:hypothetical protein